MEVSTKTLQLSAGLLIVRPHYWLEIFMQLITPMKFQSDVAAVRQSKTATGVRGKGRSRPSGEGGVVVDNGRCSADGAVRVRPVPGRPRRGHGRPSP